METELKIKRISTGVVGSDENEDILMTERAIAQVENLINDHKIPDGFYLKLSTRSNGCAGMSYMIGFDDHVISSDRIFEMENFKISVDARSLFYLMGITIDYTENEGGSGFVFNSPNTFKTCGCLG